VKDIIWLVGVCVAFIGFTTYQWLTTERRVDEAVTKLGSSVPARLSPEVEAWLRPGLARRDRWVDGGLTLGALISFWPSVHGLYGVPWEWFSLVLGMTAGTTLGTLLAGLRADAGPSGPLRASTPVMRRREHYVGARRARSVQMATPMPFVAMGLAGVIIGHGGREVGLRTLVFSAIAAVVVVVSILAARVLVSRPTVSSSPDELLWREALLRLTMEPLPHKVTGVGWFSGFVVSSW